MSASGRTWLSVGAEVLVCKLAKNRKDKSLTFDCDVLIVGSGYGGAVAAARLSGGKVIDEETKQERDAIVWVLERGLEHLPGSFPARFGELPGEVRFSRQDGKGPGGNPQGLFDVRLGSDVNVLLGNGLGGGSLINAGVMERPLPDVLTSGWPTVANFQAEIEGGYLMAHHMLAPERLPRQVPPASPLKLIALEKTAAGAGGGVEARRCNAAVSYTAGLTPAGVQMKPCTMCGDCMTGCNQSAKKTLDTNYLAWAKWAGAKLFCGGWVEAITRSCDEKHWLVHWHYTTPAKRPPGEAPFTIRAHKVVLAAGSLGSTEILLRSQSYGLTFSERLGERFSTNGDMIAAGYRQKEKVNASAKEEVRADIVGRYVGPTITGLIKTRTENGSPIAIEEFAAPAALRRVMGEVTTTFGLVQRLFMDAPITAHPVDKALGEDDLAVTTSSLEYTSIYGLMGDDGASGRIELAEPREPGVSRGDGRVRLTWPSDDERLPKLFEQQIAWLRKACAGAGGPGGTVIPNPTWQPVPREVASALGAFGPGGGSATTVHPLGGCAMANSVEKGVVDHCGRVFKRSGGVHDGLAVLDGAIVPKALGINPALTIAALAERAIQKLAVEWHIEPALFDPAAPWPERPPPAGQLQPTPARTAVTIREQLHGTVDLGDGKKWVEIEIESEEISDLAAFVRQQERVIGFTSAKLRIYPRRPGGSEFGGDGTANLESEVNLFGSMTLLGVARVCWPSRKWMGGGAIQILKNRQAAGASTSKAAIAVAGARLATKFYWRKLFAWLGWANTEAAANNPQQLLARSYAKHMGLRRTLKYKFFVTDPAGSATALPDFVGTKTISFATNANPWRQFSDLTLRKSGQWRSAGTLEADLGYFANKREALINITSQHDSATAVADVAALGLLVLRLLLVTHLPHFIPSRDTTIDHSRERSPDKIKGISPKIYRRRKGSFPRLSHYEVPNSTGRPLLMIHGLSAAGSTFTSEFIPESLAKYMRGQGRDVWVLDLRTSSANLRQDVCDFTFEDIASNDIPWAVNRILTLQPQHDQVDIVAHCIGSAMFCVAVLNERQLWNGLSTLHSKIGSVVLSQVGPLLKLSPMNRLRAYIISYLQQFLAVEEFNVRPPNGLQSGLLDALLASFPYPPGDAESQRANRAKTKTKVGDFRTVRHRADAMFGQTMELANIADKTLGALDAIYGWVKVRTLAQTIHYARHNLLTNADGDNELVSHENLSARFTFPVMLVHGRLNRVFDWRGSWSSYKLLKRVFSPSATAQARSEPDASTGVGDLHFGAGSDCQLLVLNRYGHQDTLIGKNAHIEVFPKLLEFIGQWDASPPPQRTPNPPLIICEIPWMGPMLGWSRADPDFPGRVLISMLIHPSPSRTMTQFVAIVPRLRSTGVWEYTRAKGFMADDEADPPNQQNALRKHALRACFDVEAPLSYEEFAAVTVHGDISFGPPPGLVEESPVFGFELMADVRSAIQCFFNNVKTDLTRCIFRIDRAIASRHLAAQVPTRPVTFGLASCQYPPGLLDVECADASNRRLVTDLKFSALKEAPSFLLLCGDQVYLDATAGVFDPAGTEPDDVARRAYELNWRMPAFRAVAARLPIYTMLDDHEVEDNWQPSAKKSKLEREALKAFKAHQAKLNLGTTRGSFAYQFAPAGLPIFVLDTRSKRQRRGINGLAGAVPLEMAKINPDADMRRLAKWLQKHNTAPVRFIVSPSPVLPDVDMRNASPDERLALDSWSGYPASLVRLLKIIKDANARNVVFLSGDAHLSMACKLTLEGGPVVRSVVSSGMYTPWSFANGRREHFMLDGAWKLECEGEGVGVAGEMECYNVCSKPGYAAVTVEPTSGADVPVRLRVEFRCHDENVLFIDEILDRSR